MSVTNTHYIFFGIKLDWDEYQKPMNGDDDFFYDKEESEAGLGFDLIVDDMDGQYAYAGHTVEEANSIDGFNHIEIPLDGQPPFPTDKLVEIVSKLDNAMLAFDILNDERVKLYIFTHSS